MNWWSFSYLRFNDHIPLNGSFMRRYVYGLFVIYPSDLNFIIKRDLLNIMICTFTVMRRFVIFIVFHKIIFLKIEFESEVFGIKYLS